MFAVFLLLPACTGSGRSAVPTVTPVPPLISYEKTIYTVQRGAITAEKEVMAQVVPSLQEDLFFRASGYVTRIPVKQGDYVKKGEILAELQVDDLLNQLEQARIDLEVAQTRLETAQAERKYAIARAEHEVKIWELRVELARLDLQDAVGQKNKTRAELNLALVEENLALAKLALDQVSAEVYSSDQQAVERSQLAVQRLESLLDERQIVAPYDGVVLANRLTPGQPAEAYIPYIKIGDPADLVVSVLQEDDLKRVINEDIQVYMRFSADAKQEYRLTYLPDFLPLSQSETEQSPSIWYTSFYYFGLPEEVKDQVTVGKSVRLRLVIGQKEDVLLLPPSAIRNFNGANFVIVLEGDKRRRVEISKIGLRTSELCEIEADLEEGDQILAP